MISKTIRGPVLVVLCALASAACGAREDSTWGSVKQALTPNINDFTVQNNYNKVTLTWNVSNAQSLYIYGSGRPGDFSQGGVYETANATSVRDDVGPVTGTSKIVYVRRSGTHRFTLEATSSDGTKRSVSQEIFIAHPPAPSMQPPVSNMRVEVDVLNTQAQTLSWQSATTNGCVLVYKPGGLAPIVKQSSTTFCGKYFLTTDSVTVPASDLPVGRATYRVISCREQFSGFPFCSYDQDARVTFVVGPARFNLPYRHNTAGTSTSYTVQWTPPVAAYDQYKIYAATLNVTEATVSGATSYTFTAPTGGTLPDGVHEIKLASCRNGTCSNQVQLPTSEDHYSKMELVVGHSPVGAVAQWADGTWDATFTQWQYDVISRPAGGDPLDVTFDGNGNVWGFGEFSSTIVKGVTGSTSTDIDVPLLRKLSGTYYAPVKPFAGLGGAISAAYSGHAERIIEANGKIWFVQGGQPGVSVPDYSRVVRYDPVAPEDPSTPYDDRMCAVHVPGNNSFVQSVVADGAKIWIAESGTDSADSKLAWFNPTEFTGACDNLVDYDSNDPDNPSSVYNANLNNLCDSPTDTRCLHERTLVGFKTAAHLARDPSNGCLWITQWAGSKLMKYCPDTDLATTFSLPGYHAGSGFGIPWQVRVDDSAVYITEYWDNDLLRFNKADSTWSEIHVPVFWRGNKLHSLDLHQDKVYFTMANESDNPDTDAAGHGGYFGFVNLGSWVSHLGNANIPITGTLYRNNLSSMGTTWSVSRKHSFRGIDVADATGQITLADSQYDSYFRLTPIQ